MQVQRAIPEQAHALVVAILISRVYTLFCDKQGSRFHFYYKKGILLTASTIVEEWTRILNVWNRRIFFDFLCPSRRFEH